VTEYLPPSGSRRWRVVRDEPNAGGQRRQVKRAGVPSVEEAESFLRKTLVSIDEGSYVQRHDLTVGEYLTERRLSSVRVGVEESPSPDGRSRSSRPTTSTATTLSFSRAAPRAGAGWPPKTVANVHGTLYAALQHALDRGVIKANPATRATKPSKRSQPPTGVGTR
jgi:hypothetical protein